MLIIKSKVEWAFHEQIAVVPDLRFGNHSYPKLNFENPLNLLLLFMEEF
jgi:hypothetical protein